MASNVQQRPTPLTGTKRNFTFEIWVEIEGRPLEIYGETRGEDGVLEAWIPSEEGKVGVSVSRWIHELISGESVIVLFGLCSYEEFENESCQCEWLAFFVIF